MQNEICTIINNTDAIIATSKLIEEKNKYYLKVSMDKPDIASELLTIIMNIEELIEYIDPTKKTGEIFGLSKDVSGGTEVINFIDRRGWDFNPWLLEKMMNIKTGAISLYKYWQKNLEDINLVDNAPCTPQEWLRSGMESNLHNIRVNAEAIYELTYNNELTKN